MRLVGLAVVLGGSLILAPLAAEAQRAGKIAKLVIAFRRRKLTP
jgi:hypothetical protein